MKQTKMTAQEIAANMPDGPWWSLGSDYHKIYDDYGAQIMLIGSADVTDCQVSALSKAVMKSIKGSYGQNLDPEQYAPIVEALKSLIREAQHMRAHIWDGAMRPQREKIDPLLSQAKHLLSAAIINPETTTND